MICIIYGKILMHYLHFLDMLPYNVRPYYDYKVY